MTSKNTNDTQKVVDILGNTITYINPKTVDDTKFDLDLIGKDFLTYENIIHLSDSLNKNFIKLTQHFYGEIPPFNPVLGQQWLNSEDKSSYIWLGNNWVQREKDVIHDVFMFVTYSDEAIKEFVLDEFVFNYTMNNIMLFDQDLKALKFILDSFDSKKVIIKEKNVKTVYALVFHPKDKISNPLINNKIEFITESGQTQYPLGSFLSSSTVNTLTVSLNNTMLKNNEFNVVNDILNIDGKIYRVKKNDKLNVWLHGGSLSNYKTNLKISTNKKHDFLRIPKFFAKLETVEIVDESEKKTINPIIMHEYEDYYEFEFIEKKNVVANAILRIM